MIEPDTEIIYVAYHPIKGRFNFDKEEEDYGGDYIYFELTKTNQPTMYVFKLFDEDYYVDFQYQEIVRDDDPMVIIREQQDHLDFARIRDDVPIMIICATSHGINGDVFD